MEGLLSRGAKISRISYLCEKLHSAIKCVTTRNKFETCPTIFELGICFDGRPAGKYAEISCENIFGDYAGVIGIPSRKR